MRIWLEIQRSTGIDRRDVKPLGKVGEAAGECPGCGAAPFLVVGSDHRTFVANGRCKACNDPVGYLYARGDTLFGLEEDRAVLEFGRGRVYY